MGDISNALIQAAKSVTITHRCRRLSYFFLGRANFPIGLRGFGENDVVCKTIGEMPKSRGWSTSIVYGNFILLNATVAISLSNKSMRTIKIVVTVANSLYRLIETVSTALFNTLLWSVKKDLSSFCSYHPILPTRQVVVILVAMSKQISVLAYHIKLY